MKRIGILILLSTFAVALSAQSETQTVELQEVEVKAAKVIHKPDGQTIYPTEVQKKASHSGYSILQKLSLPNIRVDEASHSLSAIDGRGSIQLRILYRQSRGEVRRRHRIRHQYPDPPER